MYSSATSAASVTCTSRRLAALASRSAWAASFARRTPPNRSGLPHRIEAGLVETAGAAAAVGTAAAAARVRGRGVDAGVPVRSGLGAQRTRLAQPGTRLAHVGIRDERLLDQRGERRIVELSPPRRERSGVVRARREALAQRRLPGRGCGGVGYDVVGPDGAGGEQRGERRRHGQRAHGTWRHRTAWSGCVVSLHARSCSSRRG